MSEDMEALDNQLETRLERLEAGDPLEVCLAGLPQAEAVLVRQAALLRAAPVPTLDPAVVARQRREFMRAAAALRAAPQPARTGRPAWMIPGLALGGILAMAVCVFAPLALGALAWLRGSQVLPVAQASPVATLTAPAATRAPATAVAARPDEPQAAELAEARGLVEWQDAAGAWQAVGAGHVVRAGQRVRTGSLSSVTLAFYDGSQARLGPQSELSIDELDAGSAGARVVVLTQWLGESTHQVSPSNDPGSRYAVNTPNGAGTAKGTIFHVQVTPTLLVRFDVSEGAVDVTHQATTVLVVAGQSTIVTPNQPPSAPAFMISGEGQVQAMEPVWQIAERDFLTHPNTAIFGEPQVGDWVSFEGRVLADGQRVLDKIVLLRRAADNRFTLVGQVTSIGAAEWLIAGRPVRVDAATQIDPGITLDSWVEVTGGISSDGAWWAAHIRPLEAPGGTLTFNFAGTVQSQSGTLWVVSGVSVTVDAQTQIDTGLVVGDVVQVAGRLLDDGRWLAQTIRRLTPGEGSFTIIGVLDSLEPLTVDGIRLVTAAWTAMDEGLAAGDRVRVSGRILDDGTWLAEVVERLDETTAPLFQFVGVITSVEPWVVAGLPLSVTAETEVDPGLAPGDLVRVRGEILPDGTWWARSITRLEGDLGCLDLHGIVVRVDGNQLILADGQVINLDGVTVDGVLTPATVIVIYGCVGEDGQFVVITIIVIYQLPELPPTPTPSPTPTATPVVTPSPADGQKVTICHRPPGNPNNAHTLSVGAPAVPAHLAHGDTLGPCP